MLIKRRVALGVSVPPTGFDALQRVFQKIKTILEKEKSEIPRFYLGTLMKLEDFVKEVSL